MEVKDSIIVGSKSIKWKLHYLGKEMPSGNYVWLIPSLDIWFQSKDMDEAAVIVKSVVKFFFDTYTYQKPFHLLLFTLVKKGWISAADHESIMYKAARGQLKQANFISKAVNVPENMTDAMEKTIAEEYPIAS
jgi:hypothetical protein